MTSVLAWMARHGRLLLVLGVGIGAASPAAAEAVRPWLPHLIASLLWLAAVRVGPAFSMDRALTRAMALVLAYQVAAPLGVLGLLTLLGQADQIWVLALVLMLAAPTLTGSPNFTLLLGRDPAISLRLLLLGTALLPLSGPLILSLVPGLGGAEAVRGAALRLVLVVTGTVALASVTRRLAGAQWIAAHRTSFDGASAILLTVLVIGLMTAIGPTLRSDPILVLGWLAFACVLNFGLQILVLYGLTALPEAERGGAAFVAGNRNIALFLIALPPATTDALLIFIGCYQIPMYLTPIALGWLYRRRAAAG